MDMQFSIYSFIMYHTYIIIPFYKFISACSIKTRKKKVCFISHSEQRWILMRVSEQAIEVMPC